MRFLGVRGNVSLLPRFPVFNLGAVSPLYNPTRDVSSAPFRYDVLSPMPFPFSHVSPIPVGPSVR